MGATSSGMNNAFIQYHSFKNRIRTYLKNLELSKLIPLLGIHIIMCEVFTAATCIKGKLALSWAIQRAIWWNIIHIRDTAKARKYIQTHMRVVSDRVYFSKIMKYPSFGYFIKLSQGRVAEAV